MLFSGVFLPITSRPFTIYNNPMTEFIRNRFRTFTHTKAEYVSFMIALLLAAFHFYQYIDSSHVIYAMIRGVSFCTYALVILLAGQKAIPYAIYVYALVIMQSSDFTQYWPFIAVVCFAIYNKKLAVPAYSLYILDVLIVCARHGKTSIHIAIHVLCCILIYFTAQGVKKLIKDKHRKRLILTDEERYILEEKKTGKYQKEIQGYSENTICKKLRECRLKNNVATTEELLMLYIAESEQTSISTQSQDQYK